MSSPKWQKPERCGLGDNGCDTIEKMRRAGSEFDRLSHRLPLAEKAAKRSTFRLLLFIARDHNPLVAGRVAWKLAVNAVCLKLGRPERYRRPFKGAGLNMAPLKRALKSMTVALEGKGPKS